MTSRIAIAGQIAEVQRELALRRNTYPRLVAATKMRQAEADLCLRRMEAVLATLLWCQEHGTEIRALMAERRASLPQAQT